MRVANEDHVHVALPQLYGAPAYARPPVAVAAPVERPVHPDDLPLESEQTDEERELARQLEARSSAATSSTDVTGGRQRATMGRGRPFRLRAITDRVMGGRETSTGA